jgi:O-antigen biosynthesis protein
VTPRPKHDPDTSGVKAVRLLDVDLTAQLPAIEPIRSRDGTIYERAWCLVRVHAVPTGMVHLALPGGALSAEELAAAIDRELHGAVDRHLTDDRAEPADGQIVGASGVCDARPRCVTLRDEALADAPQISLLIPSRDRADRLAKCLASIEASSYPLDRLEVVVVDNAPSTDATASFVGAYSGPLDVRYVREDQPGSASARNAGLRTIASDIVVFTDDDVVVDRHWLIEIVRGFSAAADVACVTGLLLPLELETAAQVWFEQWGGFSRGFDQRIYDLAEHRPDEPLYPYAAGRFGTGNNMAFRRSVLEAIGAFDPALGNGTPALGGVDSEVLLRTILRGHRLVYQPAALVHHAHREEYAALHRQIYSYGVGLTAYMLKTVISNPRRALDLARHVPRGIAFALSSSSAKNANKQATFPRELTLLELRGMIYGPIAYARSRRRFGRHHVPFRPPHE